MISDEERRRVATRLREAELADPGCLTLDTWYLEAFIHSIGKAVELGYGQRLRYRLADLIDRPTCHDDDKQEQPPVYTDWLFKCSYCGWDGQIWKSVGPGDMSLCETNYCPNCGEAVLE